MTPEQLLGNVRTMLLALMPVLGGVAAVVAVIAYGAGKMVGSSLAVHWSKNAALGAIALLGGSAFIALITNVAQRVSGVA